MVVGSEELCLHLLQEVSKSKHSYSVQELGDPQQ